MSICSIDVKRFSAISQRPFTDVLATIDAAIGHPDANTLRLAGPVRQCSGARRGAPCRWRGVARRSGEIMKREPR
jgi:hypothetical protein